VVLHEVEKNVRKKLGEMYLERFFKLVEQLVIIEEVPSQREIEAAKRVIVDKDSVILAQFLKSSCTHLITLDKRGLSDEKC
jgi:hypothetical protein